MSLLSGFKKKKSILFLVIIKTQSNYEIYKKAIITLPDKEGNFSIILSKEALSYIKDGNYLEIKMLK